MIELNVQGMTCQHCVAAVTKSIRALDAHATVAVDLASGRVGIESAQPVAALEAAIDAAGYTVVNA
jgi:copper chaperone